MLSTKDSIQRDAIYWRQHCYKEMLSTEASIVTKRCYLLKPAFPRALSVGLSLRLRPGMTLRAREFAVSCLRLIITTSGFLLKRHCYNELISTEDSIVTTKWFSTEGLFYTTSWYPLKTSLLQSAVDISTKDSIVALTCYLLKIEFFTTSSYLLKKASTTKDRIVIIICFLLMVVFYATNCYTGDTLHT